MSTLVLAKKQIIGPDRPYKIAAIITHSESNLTRLMNYLVKQGFELYQGKKKAANGAYFCAFIIPDTRICRTLMRHHFRQVKTPTRGIWAIVGMTKAFIKRREANRRTARHGHPRESPASGYITGCFTDESSLKGEYAERLAKIKGAFIDKYIVGDEQRWLDHAGKNLRAYRAAKEGKLL